VQHVRSRLAAALAGGGVALVVLLGIAVVSPAADAATNGSWQLLPTRTDTRQPGRVYLVYDARPGAVIHDSVTLSNLTDAPISFRMRTADAVNAPGNGAWALRPPSARSSDVGAWVHVGRTTITVPAQGHEEIPFDLAVPDTAQPGDHSGGIVAANAVADDVVTRGRGQVAIVREVGVRIYTRVAGSVTPRADVSELHIDRAEPLFPYISGRGTTSVRYRVRNTGNVRLNLDAQVRITDAVGRTIKRFDAARIPELLPGADVPVQVAWKAAPPVGRVTAHVRLQAAEVDFTMTSSAWAVPWAPITIAFAVVAFSAVWRRRRTRAA
jgi:uncharacterized protein (TIGR03382 family)